MNARARSIAGWEAWDEQPSTRARVVALINAVNDLAEELGVPAIELNQRIQEARRDGLTPAEAIDFVIRTVAPATPDEAA